MERRQGLTQNDRRILNELELAIQAKRDRKYGKLSPEERVVLSVLALQREVNNGGFDQFFVNSSRRYARVIVQDLERIGAGETAALASQAIASPRNREALDKLDQEYYRGHDVKVEDRLWRFAQANQAAIQLPAVEPREPEPVASAPAVTNPDSSANLKGVALTLARAGDETGAWARLRRAMELHPAEPHVFTGACRIAAIFKDWTTCLRYAGEGRQLDIHRSVRAMLMDEFGLWGARALYELNRPQEAIEGLAAVSPVDFLIGSGKDPLLQPRRLAKACREALRKKR